VKNWSLHDSGWIEIFFESYQYDENGGWGQFGQHCRTIWSSYNDGSALEDADFSNKEIERVFNAKVAHHQAQEFVKGRDPNTGTDCYLLVGHKSVLEPVLIGLLNDLEEDAPSVSWDDSYFDYYPDGFFVAHQVIPAFDEAFGTDLTTKMHETEKAVIASRYEEDPELITEG
jgi:hypothetical protein